MSWPKISIVTPSYNQGKYIEQTILSVINQNYPNLEYIIIDGGSTDETVSIIKKYEQYITYWVSEKDNGQSHAINKGIEKCTGDIFNWLNSDDWYESNALFEVAAAFNADKSIQFVSGYENHILLNGGISIHKGTFIKSTLPETIECCEVAQPSTFFRLSSVNNIGGVSNDLHYIMDGDMWIRLLLQYGQEGFVKLDKVLVNFRLHENSKTTSNTRVDNFLIERTTIILGLQNGIGLPNKIMNYYMGKVYGCTNIFSLNSVWGFNSRVITKRELRTYFIKKYIDKQLMNNNIISSIHGIRFLMLRGSIDFYLFKSTFKIIYKSLFDCFLLKRTTRIV